MKKSKFHIQFCWALAVLFILLGANALFAAEDGDLESAELGEFVDSELEVQCLRDDDCDAGWICRDIGICVPLDCHSDEDCKVSGFYCREDKVCAPEVCVYDRDCKENEFCDQGTCLTTPGEHGYPYVEGGSPNCNSAGNLQNIAVFILLLSGVFTVRMRVQAD